MGKWRSSDPSPGIISAFEREKLPRSKRQIAQFGVAPSKMRASPSLDEVGDRAGLVEQAVEVPPPRSP